MEFGGWTLPLNGDGSGHELEEAEVLVKRPRLDPEALHAQVERMLREREADRHKLETAVREKNEYRRRAESAEARLIQVDPGVVVMMSNEELKEFAKKLGTWGYLGSTGAGGLRHGEFGPEQQKLFGECLVRQREKGCTACVPPQPSAAKHLTKLLGQLYRDKLIEYAEVCALDTLNDWHSNIPTLEDWAPHATSCM
eukprot:3536677-Prymnesium_polylepis.1